MPANGKELPERAGNQDELQDIEKQPGSGLKKCSQAIFHFRKKRLILSGKMVKFFG
jgi:hypothetical protein